MLAVSSQSVPLALPVVYSGLLQRLCSAQQSASRQLLGAVQGVAQSLSGYHAQPAVTDACLHLNAVGDHSRAYVPSTADVYCSPSGTIRAPADGSCGWASASSVQQQTAAAAAAVLADSSLLPCGYLSGRGGSEGVHSMSIQGLSSIEVQIRNVQPDTPTQQVGAGMHLYWKCQRGSLPVFCHLARLIFWAGLISGNWMHHMGGPDFTGLCAVCRCATSCSGKLHFLPQAQQHSQRHMAAPLRGCFSVQHPQSWLRLCSGCSHPSTLSPAPGSPIPMLQAWLQPVTHASTTAQQQQPCLRWPKLQQLNHMWSSTHPSQPVQPLPGLPHSHKHRMPVSCCQHMGRSCMQVDCMHRSSCQACLPISIQAELQPHRGWLSWVASQ